MYFFFDESGKITQLYYNNGWKKVDMPIEAICSTPSRSLAAPISGGVSQCFFRDNNNHICQIYLESGAWKFKPIQTSAGSITKHANVPLVVLNYACVSETELSSTIEQCFKDGDVWKYFSLSEISKAPNENFILESIELLPSQNKQETPNQNLNQDVKNDNPDASVSLYISFTVSITTTITNTWSETSTITESFKGSVNIEGIFSVEENFTITNSYTYGSSSTNSKTLSRVLSQTVQLDKGKGGKVNCTVYKTIKDVPYIAKFKNVKTNAEFKTKGTFHVENGCSSYKIYLT